MKYIIYSRVSTKDQDVITQDNICFDRARREGGKEKDVFLLSENDLSSSVKLEDRPMLQKMLGMLDKKSTIIVYALDRLARNFYEQTYIRHMIKEAGSKLISCTQEGDNFIMNIHASVAEREKELIIERTINKLKEKQRRMERVGTTWYGYKLDEEKLQLEKERAKSYGKPYMLIPHLEEQRNIALMVELKKQGFGLLRIQNHLCALGYMNRAGKPFQLVAISRILYRAENGTSRPQKTYRKSRLSKPESLAQDDTPSCRNLEIPFDPHVLLSHPGSLGIV
mgnify:CR=1 FL=1